MMAEAVDHPSHYNKHPSGVECIDVVETMTFNLGNAVKYIWRSAHKGALVEDLKKAVWYVNREITRLEMRRSACNTKESEGERVFVDAVRPSDVDETNLTGEHKLQLSCHKCGTQVDAESFDSAHLHAIGQVIDKRHSCECTMPIIWTFMAGTRSGDWIAGIAPYGFKP